MRTLSAENWRERCVGQTPYNFVPLSLRAGNIIYLLRSRMETSDCDMWLWDPLWCRMGRHLVLSQTASFYLCLCHKLCRWWDHLEAHGFVPGAVERRQVLHDQLPAGSSRHLPGTLHRFTLIKADYLWHILSVRAQPTQLLSKWNHQSGDEDSQLCWYSASIVLKVLTICQYFQWSFLLKTLSSRILTESDK